MEDEVYEKIIQKKEFSQIPKADVGRAYKNFDKPRYVEEEKIKLTRNLLRKTFSGFGGKKLLVFNDKTAETILKKHLSTRERFDFYDEVYSRLLKWFKKDIEKKVSVIDLGAGVNGFSFDYLQKIFGKGKVKYVAIEAVGQLVDLMNRFFKNQKTNAIAYHGSLFNQKEVMKIISNEKSPRLILILKVIDALESFERNYTLDFLKKLESILDKKDVVVVSFATESWFRRRKFYVQRTWLINFIREEFDFIDDFNPKGERYLVFKKK